MAPDARPDLPDRRPPRELTAFPLSAIVEQEALVEALLVNAVDPGIGGVLVRGDRGTAKSTAVRGLAALLPAVAVAAGHPFAYGPGELGPEGRVPGDAPVELRRPALVELPLGATLDRLIGSLDLRSALAGEAAFEPGLLARAHRGILYVDEVNLLPDHLVDALLDAAASGATRVERDAVSVVHDARFLLVGTMNPEEGEIRPQLLDRFGLGVEVRTPTDPAVRMEIVRRRLDFERDPAAFHAAWAGAEADIRVHIEGARQRLGSVELPEEELARITAACARLGLDGVRGDIVCARAACALAALDGAPVVAADHVRRAALLALVHRGRRDPLAGTTPDQEDVERAVSGGGGDERPDPDGDGPAPRWRRSSSVPHSGQTAERGGAVSPASRARGEAEAGAAARRRTDAPLDATLPRRALALPGRGHGPAGRRARSAGPEAGRIDSAPAGPDAVELDILATLQRRLLGGREDLRRPLRSGREGALVCLLVDASGSMGGHGQLARVKGGLLALLGDAYARRDRLALIVFHDRTAEMLVRPGDPPGRAAAIVRDLPSGGTTQLAVGLRAAERLLRAERARAPGRRSIVVLVTDGRIADDEGEVRRAAASLGARADAMHVIDTEESPTRHRLVAEIARAAGAGLHRLERPAGRVA